MSLLTAQITALRRVGWKGRNGSQCNLKLVRDFYPTCSNNLAITLDLGQLLVFGSYLAHRSGANNSNSDRKAIYATYNCKSEGDLHDAYYEDRAKLWPPTHKRQEGEKYEEGALRYGFGSPMLSVDLGKQFAV